LLCVGIHCNKDRKEEYGTANELDYEGRGTKAKAYQQFIIEELLPFIQNEFAVASFKKKAIAGFSLGGLSAIDTLWNYPGVFSVAGVFSGSLWWRTKDLQDGYNDATDRIIHKHIREGKYHPGVRFYFTTGSLDETADRNGNGIIDSIDDTRDLINELVKKGYDEVEDIHYSNYEDGRHDVATWGKAMPAFLLWAFRKDYSGNVKNEKMDKEQRDVEVREKMTE
ncbi:MAG: esterase family protein, partial [Bacteroidota bacterium]|nr:esterase family protein [Bacteroidota bacterium]